MLVVTKMVTYTSYEKNGSVNRYSDNGVHQIEHPNASRKGIYNFKSEEQAIEEINKIYIEMAGGVCRPVTEYSNVPNNISFKQFNDYINSLDQNKKVKQI